MNLTRAQARSLRVLTNRIAQAAKYNGGIAFHLRPAAGGSVMLATTRGDDFKWWHRCIFVVAFIGPRGGIDVKQHDGIKLIHLKR